MKITIDFNPPTLCRQCKFREHHRTNELGNVWRCKLYDGGISNTEYYQTDKRISILCLTDIELHNMLHSIGYERGSVKRGFYKPYRNYYYTLNTDRTWDRLLREELAAVKTSNVDMGSVEYYITRKGLDVLATHIGCKIKDGEV